MYWTDGPRNGFTLQQDSKDNNLQLGLLRAGRAFRPASYHLNYHSKGKEQPGEQAVNSPHIKGPHKTYIKDMAAFHKVVLNALKQKRSVML